MLIVALLYGVSAKLSVDFATLPGKVTAIWLPSGLTTGLIVRFGLWTMPGIVLGSLVGLLPDLLTMKPPLTVPGILFLSVAFACANCLSPGISSAIFKRFAHPSLTFSRTRCVVSFLLGAVTGPAVSATIGITALSIAGSSPWALYWVSWLTWWLASVVANLLFTPPFMLWQQRLFWRRKASSLRSQQRFPWSEAALIVVLSLGSCWIAFAQGYPVGYSLLPALIWSAFRLGSFLTSVLVSCISVMAIVATVQGMGSFVMASKVESLLLLQTFVSVYSITTLILSAVLQERQDARFALEQTLASLKQQVEARTAELNESKATLDSFFAAAPIGMGILDQQLRYVQVNPPLAEIHGASIDRHTGKTIRDIIPDVAPQLEPIYQQVLATGQAILNREEGGIVASSQPIDRTWLTSYFPILDANRVPSKVGVIVMDITERKRVEDERKQIELTLRQTLQELNYHIENSPLATIRWNQKFQVEYWSKQADGIAEQDLHCIFEAFAQTAAGQQTREGTGLGLTISRRFVRLLGGDISVQSRLGQGSRFEFTVPVQSIAPESKQSLRSSRRIVALAPGQADYRILVVDDQPANRLLLVKLFGELGISVREAANGEAALDLWQAWQPDLICIDIRLPGLDGYAVTRRIRSIEQEQGSGGAEEQGNRSTVIIALTAQALPGDQDAAFAAGCDDYISKPFQAETLLHAISKHLGIRYLYGEVEGLGG